MKRRLIVIGGGALCLLLGALFAWGILSFGLADRLIPYLVKAGLATVLGGFLLGWIIGSDAIILTVVFYAPAILLGLISGATTRGIPLILLVAGLCCMGIAASRIAGFLKTKKQG